MFLKLYGRILFLIDLFKNDKELLFLKLFYLIKDIIFSKYLFSFILYLIVIKYFYNDSSLYDFLVLIITLYGTIIIGFFGTLFSAYFWNIAKEKGIIFETIYNYSGYKKIIWSRIFFFLIALLSLLLNEFQSNLFLKVININKLLLFLSIFLIIDFIFFFKQIFNLLKSLDNPLKFTFKQYEGFIKLYKKDLHEDFLKKRFTFKEKLFSKDNKLKNIFFDYIPYYIEEVDILIGKIIDFYSSDDEFIRNIKRDIFYRLELSLFSHDDKKNYLYYGYKANEDDIFEIGNNIIFSQFLIFIYYRILEIKGNILAEKFLDLFISNISKILYREDFNTDIKTKLSEFIKKDYILSKKIILNSFLNNRNYGFFRDIEQEKFKIIIKIAKDNFDTFIEDNEIEINDKIVILLNIGYFYSYYNFQYSITLLIKVIELINSHKEDIDLYDIFNYFDGFKYLYKNFERQDNEYKDHTLDYLMDLINKIFSLYQDINNNNNNFYRKNEKIFVSKIFVGNNIKIHERLNEIILKFGKENYEIILNLILDSYNNPFNKDEKIINFYKKFLCKKSEYLSEG